MSKKSTVAPAASAAAPAVLERALLVREGEAPKLSNRGRGLLTYQVLLDEARQHAYLRVSSNGTGGYFSREPVPISAIRRCLAAVQPDKPLSGPAFKAAFANKSNNNSGFLAAAMLAEGLLTRDPDQPNLLANPNRLDAWEAEVLSTGGTLATVVLVAPAPTDARGNGAAGAQETAAKPAKAAKKAGSKAAQGVEGDDPATS